MLKIKLKCLTCNTIVNSTFKGFIDDFGNKVYHNYQNKPWNGTKCLRCIGALKKLNMRHCRKCRAALTSDRYFNCYLCVDRNEENDLDFKGV